MGKTMSKKVAVVTGSNKGLGLATVETLVRRLPGATVYLTSRDEKRGQEALQRLQATGLKPRFHQLDVADRESIRRFRDHLQTEHGGLDYLVNNAAVANSVALFNDYEETKEILAINYKSIIDIEELLFPLVRKGGRIVNISSDCGHLSNVRNEYWRQKLAREDITDADIDAFVEWHLEAVRTGTFDRSDLADGGTVAAYRVAKVALSARTILQQRRLASRDVSVNSMHPGLVRTDMTLGVGFLTAAEAAATPVYLLLDAPASLRGAYIWHDRSVLDWRDINADYYFKTSTLKA